MNLCTYSDMLGKPKLGLHQYRICDIAIVDVILVFIVAGLLYYSYNKINYWSYVITLFVMGIFFHRLFCVRTTIDKLIFG